MWLFWMVREHVCVCECMSPFRARVVCLYLHVCTRAHARVCVFVPQYQILLSQLSAGFSLVLISLSTSQPSTSPSVSPFFFLSWVFHLCPSVSAALCWFLYPFLPQCFTDFLFLSSFLLSCLPWRPLCHSLWAVTTPSFSLIYYFIFLMLPKHFDL